MNSRRPRPAMKGFVTAESHHELWRCQALDGMAQQSSERCDPAIRQRPTCGCPVTAGGRAEHLREVHGLDGSEAEVDALFARSRSTPDRMVAS
jgi:hypothetical protein